MAKSEIVRARESLKNSTKEMKGAFSEFNAICSTIRSTDTPEEIRAKMQKMHEHENKIIDSMERVDKNKKVLSECVDIVHEVMNSMTEPMTASEIARATHGVLNPQCVVMASHWAKVRDNTNRRRHVFRDISVSSCYGMVETGRRRTTRRFAEIDNYGNVIKGTEFKRETSNPVYSPCEFSTYRG